MKSFFNFIAVMFFSAVSFMSFAATPKIDYAALSTENTPENSVVIIFVQSDCSSNRRLKLTQINPEFPVHHVEVAREHGCTVPLRPGACYLLLSTSDCCENPSLFGHFLNQQQSDMFFTVFSRIVVPNKPGLYIYYSPTDVEAINASGEVFIRTLSDGVKEWKKSYYSRCNVVLHLKSSAKDYKGTAWEPLIKQVFTEWKEWKNEK